MIISGIPQHVIGILLNNTTGVKICVPVAQTQISCRIYLTATDNGFTYNSVQKQKSLCKRGVIATGVEIRNSVHGASVREKITEKLI